MRLLHFAWAPSHDEDGTDDDDNDDEDDDDGKDDEKDEVDVANGDIARDESDEKAAATKPNQMISMFYF